MEFIRQLDEALQEKKRRNKPSGSSTHAGDFSGKISGGNKKNNKRRTQGSDKMTNAKMAKDRLKDKKYGIDYDLKEARERWNFGKMGGRATKKGEMSKDEMGELLKKHRTEIDKRSKTLKRDKHLTVDELKIKHKDSLTPNDRKKIRTFDADDHPKKDKRTKKRQSGWLKGEKGP